MTDHWSQTSEIAHLAAAGHRVIAPDLPGFGASDKPTDLEQYKVPRVVAVLCALLDQLKVAGKVVVVGHDCGAAVAWAMALMQPGRVRQLAVLSVGFPGIVFCANPKQREPSWYMLFFQHPEAEALLAADDWALLRQLLGKNSSEEEVQDYIDVLSQPEAEALLAADDWALLRQLLGKNSSEEEVQDYIDVLSQPGALTAGLSWYRSNLDQIALAAMKPTPPSTKLHMLVMGLWSDGEAYLTKEGMTTSRVVVTGGFFFCKRIEGAGHWMMRDASAKVNAAQADFVAAGLDPDVVMYADLM
ncbi:hypothetical protein OEZ86_001213 [Tetradesmus obliquus]|nr:hypothetical protein OEZ86_001213 [Tetradesmus obliquus]